MTARYVPGSASAVVGSRAVVLLKAALDAPAVTAAWSIVQATGELSELLESLLATPLAALPAFALAARHKDALHVVVRGEGRAVVDGAELDAQGLQTWLERPYPLDATVTLRLGAGTDDAASYPAELGVVLAEMVEFSAAARSAVPTAPVVPGELTRVPVQAQPEAMSDPTPPPAVTAAPKASGRYDHMFRAAASNSPAQPPAVLSGVTPPATASPVAPSESPAATSAPAPVTPSTAAPASNGAVAEPARQAAPGLIDGVPWLTKPTPETQTTAMPAPAAAPSSDAPVKAPSVGRPDPAADVAEQTTKRGKHQQLLAQLAADAMTPLVRAVACTQGHLNDPQRDRCRLCGQELHDQEPVSVPRPILGQLRLSTGDVVILDRGVLLGRSPKADGDGLDRPHLVKVGNGKSDVSRSHVSVSLDGWHVLVEDLRSTNGTEVTLPDRPPQRLRDGEPLLLEPGALVSLADGVFFTYEMAP